MTSALNAAEMIRKVEEHMDLEVEGDVDGVMGTLTEEVTWGTEATVFFAGSAEVRRHYCDQILPPGRFQTANFKGWADEARQQAVGLWEVSRPGHPGSYPVVAVFEFRDGRIASERLFHDASSPSCGEPHERQ
jgi:ketosteroid isomerase-like protein